MKGEKEITSKYYHLDSTFNSKKEAEERIHSLLMGKNV
jgi:hypothetical protein